MKICVIGGGGAIGGYLAVMLARAGNDVTVVARGATLAAIKERGLALIMDDQPEPLVAQVKAVEKIRDAEAPDVVILAVKAHQVEPIIEDLAAIMGPETILIPMQNGIPWWYFQKYLTYGDGMVGLPAAAPFDAIVVAAAGLKIPQALMSQLAVGGVLIAPEGSGTQRLVKIQRTGATNWERQELEEVRFVPLKAGVQT